MMDVCVICGGLAIHGGLCCIHKYDEQPDCLLCPSATLEPVSKG